MSYDRIIGNAPALARLQGAVARRRVAHAYLLAGPAGVGKKLAALAFAKSLLCAKGGCDACPECARVEAGRHPSLRLLARADHKREIEIDQIRELLRELSFRAVDDKPRIVIVDEAERMNEESQNCLLKTLEEPPDRCVIVLISASPALLLPTIVSRCQTILFMPLSDEAVLTFARERLKLDAAPAGLITRLAAGCPGRAAALAPEAADLKARAAELLAAVASGDLNTIVERISKIREIDQARERAREQLTLLAFALREIMRACALQTTPDPDLVPADFAQRLARLDAEELADRIQGVLDHIRTIDLNANVPLTVEDAMLRI
ncbi:MAG: DNA polymerase III subunit delta' [Planctomycetes bacterium]|nr:DNA polymerase III subunit delta' [Planctomycetota bacterium]